METLDDIQHQPETNALDMPSLTTVAFIAIVFMAFQVVAPFGLAAQYSQYSPLATNLVLTFLATYLLLISLREFSSAPERWIRKNAMQLLEKSEPELTQQIIGHAYEMGLQRCPTLLVTEAPRVSIQAFGTFWRNFIVINRRELDRARSLGIEDALETMFLHELAHIRHGDVWKLRWAQKIIGVFMAFSLVLMLYGVPAYMELWCTGNPHDIWNEIAALLTYPIVVLLQMIMLKLLKDIREFHADARVVQMKGSLAVTQALFAANRLWEREVKPKEQREWRGLINLRSALGLGFLGSTKSAALRLDALRGSAALHRSVHWAIVTSGFAIGTSWLSKGSMLDLLSAYFIGGLLLVGVVYLLPRVGEHRRQNLRHCIRAVGYFALGYFGCWALAFILNIVGYVVSDAPGPFLTRSIVNHLVLAASALVDTVYVVIGLVFSIPVLHWMLQAKRSRALPERWSVVEVALPVSFAAAIIALCAVMLDPNFYNLRSKTLAVALLLLLLAGGAVFLWLTGGRQHAR